MRLPPATLIVLAFGAVTCAAGPDADWDFHALHGAYVGKLEPLTAKYFAADLTK